MIKEESKMPLPKLDDLFTTEDERKNINLEKVIDIKIDDIEDFPNHPFKVIDNEEMEKMKDSIIENGVLVPALVRPKGNGKYEMVSGHRRKFASKLANKEVLPCIVKNLTDDEAVIVMVDSNLQREEVLPSEKAFAYKMKLEAMRHQGKKTSRPIVGKYSSAAELGKTQGECGRTVERYVRLTELIPELLKMVDEQKIAFHPAVALSYLKKEEQKNLVDFIDYNLATPSYAQAIVLKEFSQKGILSDDKIDEILSQEKPNQIPKIKLNEDRIRKVLPKNITNEKIEDYVINAIIYYDKYLKKQKSMDGR